MTRLTRTDKTLTGKDIHDRLRCIEDAAENSGVDLTAATDYIILLAPKVIKLSDLLNALGDATALRHPTIPNSYHITNSKHWPIIEIEDNKISFITKALTKNNKWLYLMWVGGTEIINDLEGDYDNR